MCSFQPNDRVVCIDATPLPINAPDTDLLDFSFPQGFIEEGHIYCVREVHPAAVHSGLILVGPLVLLNGQPIPWNHHRFRKLSSQDTATHLSHSQSEDLRSSLPRASGFATRSPQSKVRFPQHFPAPDPFHKSQP